MIDIVLKDIDSSEFINQFNKLISSGIVCTWLVDCDGDYTMMSEQWRFHAWMRPYTDVQGHVRFGIVNSTNYRMTKDLYGMYHGIFVVTLLSCCDKYMENLEVSSLIDTSVDVVEE